MDLSPEFNAISFEKQHVQDVYKAINVEFSNTRYNIWSGAKKFLDSVDANDNVLEVGCGNGKNLKYLDWVNNKTGCDASEELVDITLNNVPNVKAIRCCNLNLPFKNETYDVVLSIAVIHHFSTLQRRKQAISELIRVTKPGGKIFIQVWAFEQSEKSKRKFTEQDTFVGWNYTTHRRFYHVFKKGELEELIEDELKAPSGVRDHSSNVTILDSYNDSDNWVIILQKINKDSY